MKKAKKAVYISHVLFPWETFAAQAEREQREQENDGVRWTDDFKREVREHILNYANESFFSSEKYKYAHVMNQMLRNGLLNDVYRLVPIHFRKELFAGISFKIF